MANIAICVVRKEKAHWWMAKWIQSQNWKEEHSNQMTAGWHKAMADCIGQERELISFQFHTSDKYLINGMEIAIILHSNKIAN